MIEEKLCPPDPIEVAVCSICGCEIYKDEDYYYMEDGSIVCDECLAEWAAEHASLMRNGLEVDS